MLSRSTYSLASVALASGILMLLAAPCCVHAGDKIEFSAPSVSLAAPSVQHLQKDTVVPEYRLSSPGADVTPDWGVPQATVIIVGKAQRDASDSIYGDDPDNLSDDPYAQDRRSAYNSPYNPYGQTNAVEPRRDWGADSRSRDRRLDNLSQEDLRGPMDYSYSSPDQKKYEQDDRFAPRDGSADQDSAASKHVFHFGLNGDTASVGEQYLPSYQQMKLLNDQFMGVPESKSAPASSFPNASQPSVTDYNFPEEEAARRNSADATALTPSYYHPFELKNNNQTSGYHYWTPSSQNSGSQTYEQPAVLPFPKRPGSLFK